MNNYQKMWLDLLGAPSWYKFEKQCNLIKRYSLDDIDLELYVQSNGPGTFQRIIKALPKKLTAPAPAVVVPFYFPEAMLGVGLITTILILIAIVKNKYKGEKEEG